MPYNVPDFNLTAAVWLPGNDAKYNPPDFPSVPAQVYRTSRGLQTSQAMIRIPASFSNIAMPGDSSQTFDIIIEVPVGSATYYRVDRGLWMHRGFPNEYIACISNPVVRNQFDNGWIFSDSDTDLV